MAVDVEMQLTVEVQESAVSELYVSRTSISANEQLQFAVIGAN